jgi:cell division protein FtsW
VTMLLLLVPALALGALGVVMVSSATARQGASAFGNPEHFAVRQIVALLLGTASALVVVRVGAARVMSAAPVIFVVALLIAMAVFIPGVGVRAAGASRWAPRGPTAGPIPPGGALSRPDERWR